MGIYIQINNVEMKNSGWTSGLRNMWSEIEGIERYFVISTTPKSTSRRLDNVRINQRLLKCIDKAVNSDVRQLLPCGAEPRQAQKKPYRGKTIRLCVESVIRLSRRSPS